MNHLLIDDDDGNYKCFMLLPPWSRPDWQLPEMSVQFLYHLKSSWFHFIPIFPRKQTQRLE